MVPIHHATSNVSTTLHWRVLFQSLFASLGPNSAQQEKISVSRMLPLKDPALLALCFFSTRQECHRVGAHFGCLHGPSLLVSTSATSRQQTGKRHHPQEQKQSVQARMPPGHSDGRLSADERGIGMDTLGGSQVPLDSSLHYRSLIPRLHHPSSPSPSWLKIFQRRLIKAKENVCWLWERQRRVIAQDLPF